MLETTNFQANKPYIFFSMNLEGYLRESCQKKCNMLRAQFLKVTDSNFLVPHRGNYSENCTKPCSIIALGLNHIKWHRLVRASFPFS